MSNGASAATGETAECRACRDGLQHCHGTVIRHSGRRAECTEDGCVTPEAMHTFTVDCDSIGCSCGEVAALAV
jgi:hypothetical protein